MKLHIVVNGKAYEVEVEVCDNGVQEEPGESVSRPSSYVPPPLPPRAPKSNGNGAAASTTSACRSPMVGMVVRVGVQVGQHVQAGDPVITLEAMKMEMAVTAAAAGIIKAVNVKPGDAVKKDEVLVEFAEEDAASPAVPKDERQKRVDTERARGIASSAA